jgi:hypothetical protein
VLTYARQVEEEEEEESEDEGDSFGARKAKEVESDDPVARKFLNLPLGAPPPSLPPQKINGHSVRNRNKICLRKWDQMILYQASSLICRYGRH